MTIAEMDAWVAELRTKLRSAATRIVVVDGAMHSTDHSHPMAMLLARYEEMGAQATLTDAARRAERISALLEAAAGTAGVRHSDASTRFLQQLVDSYQLDNLRAEAASLRQRADEAWEKNDRREAHNLMDAARAVDERLCAAYKYDDARKMKG